MGNPLRGKGDNLLVDIAVTVCYFHELVATAFSKEEKRLKRELTTGKYLNTSTKSEQEQKTEGAWDYIKVKKRTI